MAIHNRTAPVVIARRMKRYILGERVRVLRGTYAGRVLTVRQCDEHSVSLSEMPKASAMSLGNIEPESGFSDQELANADRLSRQGA